MPIICSIDPAFKKCGVVIMDSSNFKVLFADNMNFLDNYVKENQTQYIIKLWASIQSNLLNLHNCYHPDIWLIENQIGKFACV
jgi:hypothetical protein